MDNVVRICSLEIANLKNVRQGKIDMPKYLSASHLPEEGELVGIYGQNGSGKTAVVIAFILLQRLICGAPLETDTSSLITCGESEASISLLFHVEGSSCNHYVRYSVTIAKDASGEGARVCRESVSVKANAPRARVNMIAEFVENKLPSVPDFSPSSSFSKILSKSNRQELLVNKVLAYQERTSFIFNSRMLSLLLKMGSEYSEVLGAVRCFAEQKLFVIPHHKAGLVNMNLQPVPISHMKEDCGRSEVGTCIFNLNTPATLVSDLYTEFKRSLEHVNQVMRMIIPGLNLQVKELGLELNEAGSEMMRFELLAVRQGMEIPLKYESDGIKKIFSFLLNWVLVSNTPGSCLVVDELDASIYEYLLGELLSVWQENAEGQLIFTAHNLHPLERLDKRSVVFTTTDPYHRFIRLKNVKASNNLRDVYLRSILIGGQEYELYDETDKTEIARAIRRAGKRD